MKINTEQEPILTLYYNKDKINLRPHYQRNQVWNIDKKQLLIDSIIHGYDLPKFYFNELVDDPNFENAVIDGQQRLSTIFDYKDNKFALGSQSEFSSHGNLKGKKFNDLDGDIKVKFDSYKLSVTTVRQAQPEQISELFSRLQNGTSLNAAEKRNAIISEFKDFIIETTENYRVFANSTRSNKRFDLDEWAAFSFLLESSGGPRDVKASDLEKLYKNNTTFDKQSAEAIKFSKVLNYMSKVFDEQTPELKLKWSFIDFYLLISNLMEEYSLVDMHSNFKSTFITFEEERHSIDDIEEYIMSEDWQKKDMARYTDAFSREGNKKNKIEIRHQVYLSRFLNEIVLIPKDQNRAFNERERILLWRWSNERCTECSKKIELHEMHADHIIPHSRGGKTTLANGQALCAECNLRKSNSTN